MAGVLNRSKSKCYQIAKRWRSDSYGHEKGPSNDDPSVIRLGFEPKTHSLEGCCSIQLSYRTRKLLPLQTVSGFPLQSYNIFMKQPTA